MFKYPLNKNWNISPVYMNIDLKNYINQSNKKIFENNLQKNQASVVAKINFKFKNDVIHENEYDTHSDISDSDSDYFLIDLDSINNEKPKKIINKNKISKPSDDDITSYKSIKPNNYISIFNIGFGFIIMSYISYRIFITKYKN